MSLKNFPCKLIIFSTLLILPLTGTLQSTPVSVKGDFNASLLPGTQNSNDVSSKTPISTQSYRGGTLRSVNGFKVGGKKNEGTWLLKVQRTVPSAGFGTAIVSTSKIIRHDLTPPRCVGDYPDGLNGSPGKSPVILYPGSVNICADQITNQGARAAIDGGSGCKQLPAIESKKNKPDGLTFNISDRVGNIHSCKTGAVIVDCINPGVTVAAIEHEGLGLPEEVRKGSLSSPVFFRADDGPLWLRADIQDPFTSQCHTSGVNWGNTVSAECKAIINDLTAVYTDLSQKKKERDFVIANSLVSDLNVLQVKTDLLHDQVKFYQANHLLSTLKNTQSVYLNQVLSPLSSLAGRQPFKDMKIKDLISTVEKQNLPPNLEAEWQKSLEELKSIAKKYKNNNNAANFNIQKLNQRLNELNNLLLRSTYEEAPNDFDPRILLAEIENDLAKTKFNLDNNEIDSFIPNWEAETQAMIKSAESQISTINNLNGLWKSSDLLALAESLDLEDITGNNDTKFLIEEYLKSLTLTKKQIASIETHYKKIKNQENTLVSLIKSGGTSDKKKLEKLQDFTQKIARTDRGFFTIQNWATQRDYDLGNKRYILETDLINSLHTALDATDNFSFQTSELVQKQSESKALASEKESLDHLVSALETKKNALEKQKIKECKLNKLTSEEISKKPISHIEIVDLATNKQYLFPTAQTAKAGKFDININQYLWETTKQPFFSKSGKYKVVLHVFDKVGNKDPNISATTFYIQIRPAKADQEKITTDLLNNCDADGLYANLEDQCQISILAQDRFGNIVAENSSLTLFDEQQKLDGSYDIIESLGENYPNGIRFYPKANVSKKDNKEVFTWKTPSDGSQTINLRAILPSAEVFPSLTGSAMMNTITKNLSLQLVSPKIDPRGNITTSNQAFGLEPPTRFNPWVFLYLSDQSGKQPPSNPWEVEINTKKCLYTYSTTETPSKKLPVDFDVYVKAEANKNLEFYDEDLNTSADGYKVPFRTVDNSNKEKMVCFHVRPKGGKVSLDFGFTSKIDYILEGKKIRIPGNPLGLNSAGKCIFPTSPLCCGQDGGLDLSDNRCTPVELPDPCEGKIGTDLTCCKNPTTPTCDSCPGSGLNCGSACSGLSGAELLCCQNPFDASCNAIDLNPQWLCPGLTGRALDCCLNPSNEFCVDISPTSTCGDQFAAPLDAFCCTSPGDSFCSKIASPLLPGADIEGGVIAENEDFVYVASSDEVNDQAEFLGGNNQVDVREEATRNAYELTRGINALDNTGNVHELDLDQLEDGEITYIKGGLVVIGKNGTLTNPREVTGGRHTVIVEDGNLLVAGDTEYGKPDDIFGVMMINSNPKPTPDTGNIFVHSNVRKFVGIFFADGSLTTTQDLADPSFGEAIDRATTNGSLDQQLILTGALLTRNTLGASELLDVKNPWGQTTSIENAQKYDLHYVRRYTPIKNNFGIQTNEPKCTKLAGNTCYHNKRSFIIRIDPKMGYTPPPGFTVSENANF